MTIQEEATTTANGEGAVVDVDYDAEKTVDELQVDLNGGRTNADDKDGVLSGQPPAPCDEDFDENNAPVQFVINEWAQGTSIHGVPYVTDSLQWRLWKRATWIVLVLVSAAFMLWQITQLITQYRNFDVITDTATVNSASLAFPEVTVCNSNLYSKSRKEATGITEPKNEDEILQISTPLNETFYGTWFNQVQLNDSEVWESVILTDLGRCWRFKTEEHVRRPGYYGGLKFWFALNQDDYEESAQFAGAFVWTLQPGSIVTSSIAGNAGKPGKETYLAMDYTERVRERTAPWARCRGEAPEYTQALCNEKCANDWIRENCQCRQVQDREADPSMRLCERTGQDKLCYDSGIAMQNDIMSNCDCDLPPCYEQDYELSLVEVDASINSVAFWSNAFNVTEDFVRNNFVAVTINFKSMQYNHLTESKGMSFAQLLGAIGGSMGFFLGISLVSIFELFGDLVGMRLVPRLFGRKQLYGVGARYKVA